MTSERFKQLADIQHAWFDARHVAAACACLLSHLADEGQGASTLYAQIEAIRVAQASKESALYEQMNAIVPGDNWPPDEPLRYNGSGEPCDNWNGPCSCGATHVEGR